MTARSLPRAILELLIGPAPKQMVALVASCEMSGRLRIEEAFPLVQTLGETIAAPDGVCEELPRLLACHLTSSKLYELCASRVTNAL